MDGLEIKEIKASEVDENKDYRIDSQFHTMQPKKNPLLIYKKIADVLEKSQYGISISMNEKSIGYPIYRMNEIHNMMCDFKVDKYANISESELSIFKLNDRDVLFNRTNSFEWVGRTGLYNKLDDNDFVFASYLVRFVPNKELVLPEYLTTFLNTKVGILDIKRRARQSINQTNVNPEEVKAIQIPIISKIIQNKIKFFFDEAYKNTLLSQSLYKQAEELLLKELDLLNYKPSKENIAIKSLSKSFGESGRLDSEFYQPKYDEIENIVIKNAAYIKIIKDIKTYNSRGLQPKNKGSGTLDVINSRHILENTLDYDNFNKTSFSYWEEYEKAQVFKNDILTYTTGANIGRTSTYLLDKKAIASNHVNILRIENEKPIYVSFVLNSVIGRLQTEKLSAGSAQQELYPKNIDEFYIPFVNEEVQDSIIKNIIASFKLKAESKQLLELAKQAVEVAIEKNEEEAIKLIKAYED